MKASKAFVSIVSVVFVAVLNLTIVQPAVADGTGVVLRDNATGGDCTAVGKWNANTKTCKLREDIDLSSVGGDGITVASDGITLLCNGHFITGDGSDGFGIRVEGRTGITIKYCNVQTFDTGIYLQQSNFNTLNNNTADSNVVGIYLVSSDSNTVNNNTADSNISGIFLDDSSDSNTVNHNTADSNVAGIYLLSSDSNTVGNNTADYNTAYGYHDDSATDNAYKHDECSDNASGGSNPSGLCSPQS